MLTNVVIHNPGHWICVTNVFGQTTHDVYVFDSVFVRVMPDTVIQTSSILRADDTCRTITFHVRDFQQQTASTSTCGFYAIAAAYAACSGQDITGHAIDERILLQDVERHLTECSADPIPSIATDNRPKNAMVVKKRIMLCTCHGYNSGITIMCEACSNWYHIACVGVEQSPNLMSEDYSWRGPCCDTSAKRPVSAIIDLSDERDISSTTTKKQLLLDAQEHTISRTEQLVRFIEADGIKDHMMQVLRGQTTSEYIQQVEAILRAPHPTLKLAELPRGPVMHDINLFERVHNKLAEYQQLANGSSETKTASIYAERVTKQTASLTPIITHGALQEAVVSATMCLFNVSRAEADRRLRSTPADY